MAQSDNITRRWARTPIPPHLCIPWRNHREVCRRADKDRHPAGEDSLAPTSTSWQRTAVAAHPPGRISTRLSCQAVWLPEGDWLAFDGRRYAGGGQQAAYGTREDIPAFAWAGAIVPWALGRGGVENPPRWRYGFSGADNRFELGEDDGQSMATPKAGPRQSPSRRPGRERARVHINPARGDWTHLPAERRTACTSAASATPAPYNSASWPERPVAMAYRPKTDTFACRTSAWPLATICPDPGRAGSTSPDRDRTVETCDRMLRAS